MHNRGNLPGEGVEAFYLLTMTGVMESIICICPNWRILRE